MYTKLSKISGIPYSTLTDIVNQKVDIKNVKAGILFSLAECLNLSMNQLYTLCCSDMTVTSEKYHTQGTVHIKKQNVFCKLWISRTAIYNEIMSRKKKQLFLFRILQPGK